MAGHSRFKESMEHFTLFLPSSLLSEIRQEVEYSGGTVAEKIRFYIESGRHWRKKYGEKLTELVLADARDELIEHDSGFLDREQARLKRNCQNRVNKIYFFATFYDFELFLSQFLKGFNFAFPSIIWIKPIAFGSSDLRAFEYDLLGS